MNLEYPLTTGIVFYFIYMTFELFVRKKERLTLIDKIGTNVLPLDPNIFKMQFNSLLPSIGSKSFASLRFGCLLMGVGIGLLAGFFLHLNMIMENVQNYYLSGTAYSAGTLLFGGLGLIISFVIESHSKKTDERENG
jgi:hypothetical protein